MAPRAVKKKKADEDGGTDIAVPAQAKAPAKKSAPRPTRKRNAFAAVKSESDDDNPELSASEPGSEVGSERSSADPSSEPDSDAEPAPKRTRRTGAKVGPTGRAAAGTEPKAAGGRARKAAAGKAGAAAPVVERDPPGPRYFLMKSEPEEFSLDDLAAKKDSTSHWEGVRNAQARNIMRSMKVGDEAFFYHSSCKVPAVVGVVRVVREAYPDHFAFEKSSKYYDERSTPDAPKWWMVDVQLVRRMARPVTLAELRAEGAKGGPIENMVLINKSRLSVQPVTTPQWERILEMEAQGAGGDEEDEEEKEEEEEEEKPKPKAKARAKGKAK